MTEFLTTRWENIKNRVQYLKKNKILYGESAELGVAICEELDRFEKRISMLEKDNPQKPPAKHRLPDQD
jgi:hypothetical protein